MKFLVARDAIADAMSVGSKIVERRNTYPVLANVHISAGDEALVLRMTDLDLEYTIKVDAKVEAKGATTVEARLLSDILRKLPKGGDVSFEQPEKADRASVRNGKSKFALASISPDSFPDLKHANLTSEFEIKGKDFAAALETVQFAISSEETRYYLNGVYMHHTERSWTGEAGIIFVATDGHRMAQCFYPVDVSPFAGLIVPRKAVAELIALGLLAGDEPLQLKVGDTRIRAEFGPRTLLSKLIEGTFPDYERVTPKNGNKIASLKAGTLASATDRVSTIASDRGGKAVKLTFGQSVLTLEVTNPDHGTATEELSVEFNAGEASDLMIGFNGRYLQDVIGATGRGDIHITMEDGGAPALFTVPDNRNVRFVLMPMRV